DGAPRLSIRSAAGAADHRAHRGRSGRRRAGLAAQERFADRAGHAVVEVRGEPRPHAPRELGVRARPLGVPHGLPGVPPRGAGGRQLPARLRQLHLRPGDHRSGGLGRLSHQRDRGAHALLPGSLLGELLGLDGLRNQDHHDALLVLAAPHGAEALAALRQPPRALHEVDLGNGGALKWGPPGPHASAPGEPTTCEAWWSTIFQPSASRWKMFVAMTDVTDTRPRTWERMFSVQVTQARLPETAS